MPVEGSAGVQRASRGRVTASRRFRRTSEARPIATLSPIRMRTLAEARKRLVGLLGTLEGARTPGLWTRRCAESQPSQRALVPDTCQISWHAGGTHGYSRILEMAADLRK